MPAPRMYRFLLRLYPLDFRARFAAEMRDALETAAAGRHGRGSWAHVFLLGECLGLLAGAGAEWLARWTADPAVRGRALPDLRRMRPPGIPREVWFADAGRGFWKNPE